MVPVIRNVPTKSVQKIAVEARDLAEKARSRQLDAEFLQGGTFTVTNLGMFGIRNFTAIINPPQAAILAVGEIYQEPAVVEGKIEIRSFMDISVSGDHRIIDGAKGAVFLKYIAELIENPALLVL
jgi:pyruvate dehydrogenase E2 component (dihydrolipoamide acetyltransferase)